MSRGWFPRLLVQRIAVILLLLVQIVLLIYTVSSNSMKSEIVKMILTVVSILTALHLLTRRDKGAFKIFLVFLILLFPVFGGLFYWMVNFQTATRGFRKKLYAIEERARGAFLLAEDGYEYACEKTPEHKTQIGYLQKFAGFPVYKHTKTTYLSPGERKFEALLQDLEQAEHYIFLEYFIIGEGQMWNSVLEILKKKAASGIDVRIIYDDLGCFFLLPRQYYKTLKKFGIQCTVFNPFRPLLTVVQNNRDHRKITVIDGKVAYTGGINLADEYINQKMRFGHWKDASVRLEGYAAWSFTVMFLQMWSFLKNIDEDYKSYFPWEEDKCDIMDDGLVQPYQDSPMDAENVGEHVYLQIIDKAQEYVYITTPYLLPDDSMISALTLAAKSGVDVRIITPHIPDKRLVHFTTRSYYRELINGGVKIYEYYKGFIHSKTIVSDDTTATIGTTNIDFRSLYLHFECGALLYQSAAVRELKEDFMKTLVICRQVADKDCQCGVLKRLIQDVLRLFAPLM